MNDIDWLTVPALYEQLYLLDGGVSGRRMLLAGIAACRFSDAVIEHQLCRDALDLAERYADGLVEEQEMLAMARSCIAARDSLGERVQTALYPCVEPGYASVGLPNAMEAIRMMEGATRRPNGVMPASKVHRSIFNDIFGKLFRAAVFQPKWRTPTVLNVARTIYDEQSFDDLPVLADALEDADCDWAAILDHLRGPGPHYRGCWALDQCLGFDDMTEEGWLDAADPWPMYLYALPLMGERKLRLLGCGFCRRIWDLADDFFENVLLSVERHVEGEPPRDDELVYLNNDDIFGGDGPVTYAFGNLSCIDRPPAHTTGSILHHTADARGDEAFMHALDEFGDPGPETSEATRKARLAEKNEQAKLMRCLVGNPFHDVTFDAMWKTPAVVALAQNIYADHDFSRMPELADALVEAGCDNGTVLSHCRGVNPHARGCWVVDGLLDRG